MPRLRPGAQKRPAPTAEFPPGAFARCLATHTGRGGYVENGWTVPLDHPNLTAAPEHFEIVWRPQPRG